MILLSLIFKTFVLLTIKCCGPFLSKIKIQYTCQKYQGANNTTHSIRSSQRVYSKIIEELLQADLLLHRLVTFYQCVISYMNFINYECYQFCLLVYLTSWFHHSHKNRKDSLETQAMLLIFSLELEISVVAVQRIHQNSKKWWLLWKIA